MKVLQMRVISVTLVIAAFVLWGSFMFIGWVRYSDLGMPFLIVGGLFLILAFYIIDRVRQKEKTILKN